jgi:cytoskeletal protein CcmA (bactofilin family)
VAGGALKDWIADGIDRPLASDSSLGKNSFLYLLFLSFLMFASLPASASYDAGGNVLWTEPADTNLYLAGDSVRLKARAGADVAAAGGRVILEEAVEGDVLAAGGQVEIRGAVGDDIRVAGGQVRLGNAITNDAIAAGGHVWLQPEARVGGRAWFAGGSVDIEGHVAGELRAAAKEITIAGTVEGDALIHADKLRILPGASIGGRLDYISPREAVIAPGAKIGGPIEHHRSEHSPMPVAVPAWIPALWGIAVLMVTAIVYVLLVPRFAIDAADTLGQRPWASLGLGVAVLFATPPVAILLMVTMLGALVGFMLLLVYMLLLVLGFLTGVLFLGRVLLLRPIGRKDSRSILLNVVVVIVAVLLLAVLGLVPVAGPVLFALALVLGIGAATLRLFRARQSQMVSPI